MSVLVPGHGVVAEGLQVAAAQLAYLDALRRGEDPVGTRLSRLALRPRTVEAGAGPTLIRMNLGVIALTVATGGLDRRPRRHPLRATPRSA